YECVESMQQLATAHGGEFVRSKGDDVLCLFSDANAAIAASRDIIKLGAEGQVSLHAGLHRGMVVYRGSELFGDAVNIAARLSSQAKDNEVLISRTVLDHAKETDASDMRSIGELTLRGINMAMEIYALLADEVQEDGDVTHLSAEPTMFNAQQAEKTARTAVRLTWPEGAQDIVDGNQIRIGRSSQCDLVMSAAWVSRVHAAISVRGGIVEFQDSSSAGSTLAIGDAPAFFIRRQTVALSGRGVIELGNGTAPDSTTRIAFEVVHDF
ncbi:MAG: FHA domain-containing protein, partial [Tateyamaria sp.]